MALSERPESVLDRFWKLAYARHSFEHAKVSCDHIITNAITSKDDIYYPLVLAIHVVYVRPFKRSQGGVKKLDDKIVPERFRDLHKQMINIRDQVLAHTDAVGSNYRGLPANQVRLKVEIGGSVKLVVQDIKPRDAYIPNIRDLCDYLIGRTTKDMEQIGQLRDFIDLVPFAAGEYMVDLKGQQFVALSFD